MTMPNETNETSLYVQTTSGWWAVRFDDCGHNQLAHAEYFSRVEPATPATDLCDACGARSVGAFDMSDTESARHPYLNGVFHYCATHGRKPFLACEPDITTRRRSIQSGMAQCDADLNIVGKIVAFFGHGDGRYCNVKVREDNYRSLSLSSLRLIRPAQAASEEPIPTGEGKREEAKSDPYRAVAKLDAAPHQDFQRWEREQEQKIRERVTKRAQAAAQALAQLNKPLRTGPLRDRDKYGQKLSLHTWDSEDVDGI